MLWFRMGNSINRLLPIWLTWREHPAIVFCRYVLVGGTPINRLVPMWLGVRGAEAGGHLAVVL